MTPEELRARYEAHRAVHVAEHDLAKGRIHGYCLVCGVPWPCEYAGSKPGDLARFEIIEPKHADLLRERDEARAEVETLKQHLEASRSLVKEKSADAERWMMTSQKQAEVERGLRAEVERLKREGSPGVLHAVDQAFLEVTVKERNAARSEAATLRAEVERLRAAPPVVHTTNIEAAVRLLTATDGSLNAMKLTPDGLRYTLRACTRPLDREGLAAAILPAWGDTAATVDAVLRHIGAHAAQPVEPKPPEPAKVRVKLPQQADGTELTDANLGYFKALFDVRKALREQGVEVDE